MSFVIDTYVENRHDQNCLNSTIKENNNQAPKTANTDKNILKLPWISIIESKTKN